MRALRIVLRLVGSAALLALLVVVLIGVNHPLEVGSPAPPVKGARLLDGRIADWKPKAGAITVVNIWATWCPPCVQELPELVAASEQYRDRGVRFVGLAADSDRAKLHAMVERFRISYDIAEIDGRTARLWNATSLPSTYILDGDGRIAWSIRGAVDRELLAKRIEPLLLAPAPAPASAR